LNWLFGEEMEKKELYEAVGGETLGAGFSLWM